VENSNVDAKFLYDSLNDRLFDGLLPFDYQIEFLPAGGRLSPDDGDECGECDNIAQIIYLTEPLKDRPEPLRRMLIHEMVHVAEGLEHNEAFFGRLIDIAERGEEWAWDEARDYHPCQVRKTIHEWRNLHLKIRREGDLRQFCTCEACIQWQERGCPNKESLEQWQPWEPQHAPVNPHAKWIEKRAFKLVSEKIFNSYIGAWERARKEAKSLK